MQVRKTLTALAAVTLFVLAAVAPVTAQLAKTPANKNHATKMHPAVLPGPMAELSDAVAAPGYGLRTCQVVGYPGVNGACYDPYQMRKAYGMDAPIAAGYDGKGKTIVILDAFSHPNIQSQLDTFDTYYGLPSTTITQVFPDGQLPFNPADPNMVSWAEEISLDVEWAHAIAPGAKIVLELGKDNSDEALVSAINDAINHNRGDVISMSFGESDTCVTPELNAAWHQAFVNATAKGITLFASAGDEGAALPSCDGNSWIKSASAPASDPLVVGVGGTELHAAGFCLAAYGCNPATYPAFGTYQGEIGWNEGLPYGDFGNVFGYGTIAGGGGFSTVWSEPPYQQGTIHGGKQRGVADVSYNGSVLHGVLTYLNIPGVGAGWYRFGGTSAGAPQWAAITVIADQFAGHNYGFINSTLYKIGQSAPHYLSAFHDVTSGTNSSLQFDVNNNPVDTIGYSAGPGWDPFTGLGSPKVAGLFGELSHSWSEGQANAAIANSKAKGTPGNPGKNRPN